MAHSKTGKTAKNNSTPLTREFLMVIELVYRLYFLDNQQLFSCWFFAMPVWSQKDFVSTKPPTALKDIWPLTRLGFPSLRTAPAPMSRMMPD
ncbi:MAG: hypothetical protein ACFKPT_12655 [Gloeotrichia echinulata GP01]